MKELRTGSSRQVQGRRGAGRAAGEPGQTSAASLDLYEQRFRHDFSFADPVLWFFRAAGMPPTRFEPTDEGSWFVWVHVSDAFREEFALPTSEVLVFCAPWAEFQGRSLRPIDRRFEQDRGYRVERTLAFLVHRDSRAEGWLRQLRTPYTLVPITTAEINRARVGEPLPPHMVRQSVEKFLYARDHFHDTGPVSAARFFGRQDWIARLTDAVLAGRPTGLFGLRKIGKTSLLHKVVEKVEAISSPACPHIVVYLDLNAVFAGRASADALLWRLGEALHARMVQHDATLASALTIGGRIQRREGLGKYALVWNAAEETLDQVEQWLRARCVDSRVVVIMDEMERLVPLLPGDRSVIGQVDLLRWLRGRTQGHESRLSLLVTAANPSFAERPTLGRTENPVFNLFSRHYLPPLTRDETREMVRALGRRSGVRFDHEPVVDALYETLGGHPFLTRMYCSFITTRTPAERRPHEVTKDDLLRHRDGFVAEYAATFREIVETLDTFYREEVTILDALAARDDWATIDELSKDATAISHIEGYRIVERDGGRVRFASRLFRDWVRQHRPGRVRSKPTAT
jgi:serine/threonine-protein kinase